MGQLNNFFNFIEEKNEGGDRTLGIYGEGVKKHRISKETKEAWDKAKKVDAKNNPKLKDRKLKIGGTFKGNDLSLETIAKYYREKGNSYLEVANSGLFYLGNDQNGNFINAPRLIEQKT